MQCNAVHQYKEKNNLISEDAEFLRLTMAEKTRDSARCELSESELDRSLLLAFGGTERE